MPTGHTTLSLTVSRYLLKTAQFDRMAQAGVFPEYARLYARAGVGEYWVVDLQAHVIVCRRQPAPLGGYQVTIVARRGDALSAELLPDVVVRLDEVLR
jgi:Uma2 family endonuclease